ncbi:MAG: C40 family peptidase [Geodermatophilaceae bacterium]|nr:C40 family peptidase [Geodermatophilaceae bacterium]
MLRAVSEALASTLTVPCTRVAVRVHDAPCGTRRLSTVTAPRLPRQVVSSACATAGMASTLPATPTARTQLQPGDLVFYYSPVSHVGIYVGSNQLIEAPNTGSVVSIRDFDAWGGYSHAQRVALP